MKRTLGNLLLILGTVVGALAAANSERAYRVVELPGTGAVAGQFLYADVAAEGDAPEVVGRADQPLEAELVAALRAMGLDRVRVRHPAVPSGEIPLEEAPGRVLAAPVSLAPATERFKAGRIVTTDLRERALGAGLAALTVVEEDGAQPRRKPLEPATAWTGEERLAEELELPDQADAGRFVDEALMKELSAAGVERVSVMNPVAFSWGDWTWRWGFVVAVLLMLGGAFLKRQRATELVPGAAADAGGLPELVDRIEALERGVAELVERGDALSPDDLHARVDRLLTGPVYDVIESREALRERHGLAAYAALMGPFAAAERKLNRAWSASVDEYPDETRDSLAQALPLVQEARRNVPGAAAQAPPAAGIT